MIQRVNPTQIHMDLVLKYMKRANVIPIKSAPFFLIKDQYKPQDKDKGLKRCLSHYFIIFKILYFKNRTDLSFHYNSYYYYWIERKKLP